MSSNRVTVSRKGVGPQAFLRACAQFTTGVAIATVLDAAGAPHGITVNSFTSVSLDPPLVLICIDHKARVQVPFRSCEFFAINILRESQQALSERFARPGEDRFQELEWYPGETQAPLVPDALAHLECGVYERLDAGDHMVVIGEVVRAVRHEGRPLIYFSSGYRTLDSGEN